MTEKKKRKENFCASLSEKKRNHYHKVALKISCRLHDEYYRRSRNDSAGKPYIFVMTFNLDNPDRDQRYTIQMKLILLCVWAELVVLGSAKTALKFKYEI